MRSLERTKSHEETCDADGLKPKEQQQRGFHLCLLLLLSLSLSLSCSWSWEFQSNWEPSWGLLFSRALSNAEEALFHSVWNSGLKCAYFLKEFQIILSYSVHFIFYTPLFSPFFERKNNSISRSAYWNILKAVCEDELKRPACWSQVLTFCLRAKSIRKVSYYYREEARAPAYYKSIEQASHWLWLKRVSWHRNFQFEASWHRLESCLLWCLPQHQHLD